MKKIEIEELKEIQLELLQYIHDFCIKQGINYSLCGGTLIGAVRHKGYIPWDDDIDIMMPRPDYEKFLSLFNNSQIQKNVDYKVIDCTNDKQYFQPFAKVVNIKTSLVETYDRPLESLGAYVDVFPCDGLPDDSSERDLYWKKIFRLRNLNTIIYQKKLDNIKGLKKILRKILYVVFKMLPATFYAKKVNAKARRNDFESAQFVACSVFGYGRREEVPHSVFDSYVDLTFEGRKFKAMIGYDKYLSSLYGDYMQLPPEEKRVAKHDFEVFWR